jgi:hypothetical protein
VHGALEDQEPAAVKDLHLLLAFLGIGLGTIILLLVRRDHLYIRHGVFWMVVALVSAALGVWPSLVDRIGQATGVAYPPALLLLLAIMMLIVRAVISDMAFTRLSRDVRLLNQKIALMEAERAPPPGDEATSAKAGRPAER